MHKLVAALTLAASLSFSLFPAIARAAGPLDYDIAGGHFYSETNGTDRGPAAGGYSITDANQVPFWAFFQQNGGVDLLGYPVSQRFVWDGFVCQATQRAIMQWNPASGQVQLANVFDDFSQIGKDNWLLRARLAPKEQAVPEEAGASSPLSFLMLAHYRFGWLYKDPAIFHHYFSTPNYYAIYGLPTSPVVDLGPYLAVRFQRMVMYHWKFSVPWADNNGVSVGLAGDLFKEVGLIPTGALQPAGPRTQPNGIGNLPEMSFPSTANQPLPAGVDPAAARPAPAPPPAAVQSPPALPAGLPTLVGVATWYGGDFQGMTMSDGAPYDMYNAGTTAANLYPLGTLLRVTRLSTGRSIVVRVTDRGAFRYPDICDLSYAAFSSLADPSMGVIGVRVEPIS